MNKTVLAVTSQTGAGKDTLGDFLKKRGYVCVSLSDELRRYALKNGLSVWKEDLQNLGDKVRGEFGSDILARWVSGLDEFKTADKVVVTGVRHPAEIEYLREHFGAKTIGLKASQETRFEFARERDRLGDPETFEKFVRLDNRELKNGNGNPHAMQVDECLCISDIVIYNEKRGTTKEESLRYFEENLDKALSVIGIEWPGVGKERETGE